MYSSPYIHLSYETAKDLLQLFVIYPRNTVVNYDQLTYQWMGRQESTYKVNIDKLSESIRNRESKSIDMFFDDLYKDLNNQSFLTHDYVQTLLIGFLGVYINLIKEFQLEIDQETLFARLWKLRAFDEHRAFSLST